MEISPEGSSGRSSSADRVSHGAARRARRTQTKGAGPEDLPSNRCSGAASRRGCRRARLAAYGHGPELFTILEPAVALPADPSPLPLIPVTRYQYIDGPTGEGSVRTCPVVVEDVVSRVHE